nr:hypothetical protein [Nostoc sp. ChiSLP03a]
MKSAVFQVFTILWQLSSFIDKTFPMQEQKLRKRSLQGTSNYKNIPSL